MAVAISRCVPMASIVTRAPWSASRSSRSGMAVISFDLPATASCPSTSRWRVAQAETRCRGSRPLPLAWVRREVLPSTAMMSGSAARRPSTQQAKQLLNKAGSSAAITSPSVSLRGLLPASPSGIGSMAAWPSMARDAGPAGQEAAQEGQVLPAPDPDLGHVVRSGQGGAERQEQDLGQRVEHLGPLPRILQRSEVVEQRGAGGGAVHGRLHPTGRLPARTKPGRKLTSRSSDRPARLNQTYGQD